MRLPPPMEQGSRADEVAAGLQGDTALGLRVFELVNAGEVAINQDGVGQRPAAAQRVVIRGNRQAERADEQVRARAAARYKRVEEVVADIEHYLKQWNLVDATSSILFPLFSTQSAVPRPSLSITSELWIWLHLPVCMCPSRRGESKPLGSRSGLLRRFGCCR
ncbi:MAG: hypothetical protein C5B60_03270 [Chloroflexi bacterium]|nr:MAG: hypothetical protein C5B60_03270 [Chloroflexota bacterium]